VGSTEPLAIDHPEKGDLMAWRDLLRTAGYDMETGTARRYLDMLGVPDAERVLISRSMVIGYDLSRFPNRGLIFLTRPGCNHVLMASTKPEAKEYREWLAGRFGQVPSTELRQADAGGRYKSNAVERIIERSAALDCQTARNVAPRSAPNINPLMR